MNEDVLFNRLQILVDQSRSTSRRDERFLAAMLISTRLPPSALHRLVDDNQTTLRFALGLVSHYLSCFESLGSDKAKEWSSSVGNGVESEAGTYLALASRFFSKYYDRENATSVTPSTNLDNDVHSSLLKTVKLRTVLQVPLGSIDVDIYASLERIIRHCTLRKHGVVNEADGLAVIKSGSALEDWIHGPACLLRRCLQANVKNVDESAALKRFVVPTDQVLKKELARCLMMDAVDSVLNMRSSSPEGDNHKVMLSDNDGFRYQCIELFIAYLEAHMSQSLSIASYDLYSRQSKDFGLRSTIEGDTDLSEEGSVSDLQQFSILYERDFLVELFRYTVQFPRHERMERVAEMSMRLNSIALMLIIYSTRGNSQSLAQFDLGKALLNCKSSNHDYLSDEIAEEVLQLILHCLLLEPANTDIKIPVGVTHSDASFRSLTFEAIAMVAGMCGFHWMIRDVKMSPHAEVALNLESATALCLVIRLAVGNLRMSLGHLLDCIAEDDSVSVNSTGDSIQVTAQCCNILNNALNFVLSLAEGADNADEWSTSLNAEALLHVRSSLEDAIDSVVQFLIHPNADTYQYRSMFLQSNYRIETGSIEENVTNERSAYECAAMSCCSFLGLYFAEESVFTIAGSSESFSESNILVALRNGLMVCFCVDVKESSGMGRAAHTRGRITRSLLPCLITTFSLCVEEGEEGVVLLADTLLKDGLCTSAVCFLMNDLLPSAEEIGDEAYLDSQVLSQYICCCDIVKELLKIDQVILCMSNPSVTTAVLQGKESALQQSLLSWLKYLVSECKKMLPTYFSHHTNCGGGALALVVTTETLMLLLENGTTPPEANSALEQANQLIKAFQ